MTTDKLRELMDERAVSPVIGVILMVAITVILAAVIGTFVLGLGGQVSETAPQASVTITDAADPGVVEVSHDGGDSFNLTEVTIYADGDEKTTITDAPDDSRISPAQSFKVDVGAGTKDIKIVDNSSGQMIAQATVDVS